MLFDTAIPETQFVIDPRYLPDDKKAAAAILGFKQSGERNTWGKIARFLPNFGTGTRRQAMKIGEGFNTFTDNVEENAPFDAAASRAGIGIMEGTAGVVSEIFAPGNPFGAKLIGGGIQNATAGIGGIQPIDLSNDWQSSIHYMKNGGNANWWEGPEDLAMIDKETGQHKGDISYGERVFSKEDNRKMMSLKEAGDMQKLGEYVSKAMNRQSDYDGDGQLKKGGVLSADKAKQILKDGTVYGKPITEKQKKFFGWVAGGGHPKKYKGGGPVDGPTKAPIYVEPNDPRIQAFNDSMYLYNRSNLLLKNWQNTTMNQDMIYAGHVNPVEAQSLRAPFERLNWPKPEEEIPVKVVNSDDYIMYPMYKKPTQPYLPKQYSKGDTVSDPTWLSKIKNSGLLEQLPEGLFNIMQFATGLSGTKGQLPDFNPPEEWDQFLMEQRKRANEGISGYERGQQMHMADRGLTAGLDMARETSGGNSAFAVGDASHFTGDYIDQGIKLALLNDQFKRQSQQDYGRSLLTDIQFDKDNFLRRYEETLRKKSAAADLARTGLQSMIDQVDYQKNYGKNSLAGQYLQSLIDINKKISGEDFSDWLKQLFTQDTPEEDTGATGGTGGTGTFVVPGTRYH